MSPKLCRFFDPLLYGISLTGVIDLQDCFGKESFKPSIKGYFVTTRLRLVPLIVLFCISCATRPEPAPLDPEAELTPNWETHKNDAEIMNGPVSAEAPRPSLTKPEERVLEIQQFIILNYTALSEEMAAGKGKLIPQLLRRLGVQKSKAQAAIRQIRNMYKTSKDSQEFSSKVTEVFLK